MPLIVLVPVEPIPGSIVAEKVPDTPVGEYDVTVIVPLPNAMLATQPPVLAVHDRVRTDIEFPTAVVFMVPAPTELVPTTPCPLMMTPVPSCVLVAPIMKSGTCPTATVVADPVGMMPLKFAALKCWP